MGGRHTRCATTHLKEAYIRRTGLMRSDKTTVRALEAYGQLPPGDRHHVRPGLPVRSAVRSTMMWVFDPAMKMDPYPCEEATETAVPRGQHALPPRRSPLPGLDPNLTDRFNTPYSTQTGGAETMYPEYIAKMKTFRSLPRSDRRQRGWTVMFDRYAARCAFLLVASRVLAAERAKSWHPGAGLRDLQGRVPGQRHCMARVHRDVIRGAVSAQVDSQACGVRFLATRTAATATIPPLNAAGRARAQAWAPENFEVPEWVRPHAWDFSLEAGASQLRINANIEDATQKLIVCTADCRCAQNPTSGWTVVTARLITHATAGSAIGE